MGTDEMREELVAELVAFGWIDQLVASMFPALVGGEASLAWVESTVRAVADSDNLRLVRDCCAEVVGPGELLVLIEGFRRLRAADVEAVRAHLGTVLPVWLAAEVLTVGESWCPQCGPGVERDEDGCCASCAVGDGVNTALRQVTEWFDPVEWDWRGGRRMRGIPEIPGATVVLPPTEQRPTDEEVARAVELAAQRFAVYVRADLDRTTSRLYVHVNPRLETCQRVAEWVAAELGDVALDVRPVVGMSRRLAELDLEISDLRQQSQLAEEGRLDMQRQRDEARAALRQPSQVGRGTNVSAERIAGLRRAHGEIIRDREDAIAIAEEALERDDIMAATDSPDARADRERAISDARAAMRVSPAGVHETAEARAREELDEARRTWAPWWTR